MDEHAGGWEPLIRRAGRGDPLAQDRLVRVLSPYVARVCGAIALQHGDDAMQETFIAILRGGMPPLEGVLQVPGQTAERGETPKLRHPGRTWARPAVR